MSREPANQLQHDLYADEIRTRLRGIGVSILSANVETVVILSQRVEVVALAATMLEPLGYEYDGDPGHGTRFSQPDLDAVAWYAANA